MKTTVTILLILTCSYAFCQNNILVYDPDKRAFANLDGGIPFGESIIINGTSKINPNSLTVKSIFGFNEITNEGNISGNKWSVKVGPFPKRTNIIFEITEKTNLTTKEIDEIIQYWEESIVGSLQKAIDSNISFVNEEEYFNTIFNPLKENFIQRWNSIFLSDGQNLSTYVISLLESEIKNNWDNWNTNSSGLREPANIIQNSQFYNTFLVPYRDRVGIISSIMESENPVLTLFSLEDESINDLIDEIISVREDPNPNNSALKNLYKLEISISKSKYENGIAFLKNEINKITLIRSETVEITHFARAETLGLESYLGVDLGAVYTHNTSTTNFFVNLNPYLKKTDPEKDYPLFSSNILHNLTPSVGFGIGSGVENIKPVYFVGMGLRINKAIRFGFGGTYFLSNETKKYDWNPSFYGSISINFISDLFRLINSASTNIQN